MVTKWLPWLKRSPETQAVVESAGMVGMQDEPVWAPHSYANFAGEGYAGNEIVNDCIRTRARAGTEPVLGLVRVNKGGAREFEHPHAGRVAGRRPDRTQD